jgi:threonine dehydratase
MAPLKAASADAAMRVWERLAHEGAEAARAAIADVVRHTPVLTSRSLSEACGGRLLLKAENLQRTGSFKLRGALHKLARLGEQAE